MLTDDLEFVWPEVAARLRSMLRRRGVRHHDIDEIVQETAARVISTGVRYDDADDLFRWASVVGGRLAIDLRRRGARLSEDELPDRADTVDVAMAAEHRVVLGAVRNRLPELSLRDQEVLLSSFHDEPAATRRESVRVAVARHRARNRLRVLLDGLAGSAIFVWARRNRVWSAPVEAISYAVVPTAACLLITVGAWSGLGADRATAAAPSKSAAQIAAVVSVSNPTLAPAPVPTAPSGSAPQSPPRPLSGPVVQQPYVIIDDPTGETRAGVRPKQETDHLWCVTSPSLSGPETRCVDSPVTLPTPP
ncbi:MAG: hypothetical protein QOI95_2028 [Acidimicrobiaceae bacterium]|jgi:DNA-directed RNA polymerase specialized sigma24 family protein